MKIVKILWKQCTTSGASPKRTWERGRQNTLRRYGCEDGCVECDQDSERFEALWRLVERKRRVAGMRRAIARARAAVFGRTQARRTA